MKFNLFKNPPKTHILKALLFGFFIGLSATQSAHALQIEQKLLVNNVVQAFKHNNRLAISKLISYPLLRHSSLTPIRNQQEFLSRYNEIFDQTLLNTIVRSNIHTDWDSVGWRGVILNNGIVALDPDGNITAINYISTREQAMLNNMQLLNIAKGRRAIHRNQRSVVNNNQTVVELTTAHYQIRVDNIAQGGLRYTAWSRHKSTTEKPDLVLQNGRLLQGSGRNQRFVFDNGAYRYQLKIQAQANGAQATGSLEVFKAGKPWLREVATRVIRR